MSVQDSYSQRVSADISANKTLDVEDCGVVQNVTADAITITLPATAVGLTYTIRNAGALIDASGPAGARDNQSVAVTVSPNASDKIQGLDSTATDDKDVVNTKATAQIGDEITLVGDGVDGWFVQSVVGTWAREA